MKKVVFALACVLISSLALAQNNAPQPRSIAVIGTAEIEVTPDEIYVYAELREFTRDKKKYMIEDLEKGMVNFIESVTKTPAKDITMDDVDGDVIALKRKTRDAVITKVYEIKFKDYKQVSQFMAATDSLFVRNSSITRYSHSKIDEYKKQVKIDAIKAAKTKADYLLEAIGSKTGKPLSISETTGYVSVNDRRTTNFAGIAQTRYNARERYEDGDTGSTTLSTKKIKLSYSINAEFEIL
jgi:uncharacterized protein YggE